MHPSSSRAFQGHKEHNLKHPDSMDLITTQQFGTCEPHNVYEFF
jgi:hypothetical protein